MKKHFFKLRTAAMILSMSGLMVTFTIPSFANKKIEVFASEAIQPTVSYLSSDEQGSSVLVQVEAAAPVKFEIAIKDKSGHPLYSQVFEAATFSKTFKLLKDNNGNLDVVFTIKTLPDGDLNTYNITSKDKLVSEVSVKKIAR